MESIEESIQKNKKVITSFYKDFYCDDIIEIRKLAINGSTFRSFHKTNKLGPGMSQLFTGFLCENKHVFHNHRNRNKIVNTLIEHCDGRIKMDHDLGNEYGRFAKVVDLTFNYLVAFHPSYKTINHENLNLALDQYSLKVVSEIMGDDFPYKRLSMGSIKTKKEYLFIQNYLRKKITKYPIVYLDFIHEKSKSWYSNKRFKTYLK